MSNKNLNVKKNVGGYEKKFEGRSCGACFELNAEKPRVIHKKVGPSKCGYRIADCRV